MSRHSNCWYVTILGIKNPVTGGDHIVIEGRTEGEAFRKARDFAVRNGMRIVSEGEASITVR